MISPQYIGIELHRRRSAVIRMGAESEVQRPGVCR